MTICNVYFSHITILFDLCFQEQTDAVFTAVLAVAVDLPVAAAAGPTADCFGELRPTRQPADRGRPPPPHGHDRCREPPTLVFCCHLRRPPRRHL